MKSDAVLQVAVVQTTSVDDLDANKKNIESLLQKLQGKQLDLICLPENSIYMRVKEGDKIRPFELSDEIFDFFKGWAQKLRALIHLGSVPLKISGHLQNASVKIWPDGRVESTYQKIHLFDIALEGQMPIRESDAFKHGARPSSFVLEGWKIGQSICYDLRFAELYSEYARMPVDIILVPSAFLVTTGKAHWEVLLRARAIESQCFIIAAAQAGVHKGVLGGERATYGHSLVVDPWGQILHMGSADQQEVFVVTLERGAINKVRRQIPMASHRRIKT